MVCGDVANFRYRSSRYITEFFADCGTNYVHDGSTRPRWVAARLGELLNGPRPDANTPPQVFEVLIRNMMDPIDAQEGDPNRKAALTALNQTLAREQFEAYYAGDGNCYVRRKGSMAALEMANPHRPFTAVELERRDRLAIYLESASEDEFTEEVLLPLFRQLNFQRITPAGHKDKALEYGKDIWMKYQLPTQHMLYFGVQVKKGKIDAAGTSTSNVAEIHNQVTMMLGHEIFDPEIGKSVLVDHAYIVSAGDITKQARNWLGNKLDKERRRSIIFMDRKDILDLFAVTNAPLPPKAMPPEPQDELNDLIPF